MKAIMPKSWQRLPESEKNKIAEACEQQMVVGVRRKSKRIEKSGKG